MDKHLFIINPTAGKKDASAPLIEKIRALPDSENVSYALTKAPGHAKTLVREALSALVPGDRLRVYACGGDGTLFEVVNGGAGHPAFAVTAVPFGSGNDFIKTFPDYTKEDFLDLPRLTQGPLHRIDSLKVGEYTSLNIISAGFDAEVCRYMVKYKDLPLVSGSMAYKLALIDAVIKNRRNFFRLLADGEEIEDGSHPHLFAIAANGCYYGGGFKASPTSRPDDGWMDVITVPSVSVFQFARFVGIYRRGEHIDNPAMPFVKHSVRRSLQICSPNEVTLNVDGEMIAMRDPVITLDPQSVDVILPAKK
ncbi:MAG: hypothetical protein MJ141_07750 [Clostridia bacterium]|nr:hypothetical protein [Clostridia bacterium]